MVGSDGKDDTLALEGERRAEPDGVDSGSTVEEKVDAKRSAMGVRPEVVDAGERGAVTMVRLASCDAEAYLSLIQI